MRSTNDESAYFYAKNLYPKNLLGQMRSFQQVIAVDSSLPLTISHNPLIILPIFPVIVGIEDGIKYPDIKEGVNNYEQLET